MSWKFQITHILGQPAIILGTYKSDQTLEHIEEMHLSIYEFIYKLLKELLVTGTLNKYTLVYYDDLDIL